MCLLKNRLKIKKRVDMIEEGIVLSLLFIFFILTTVISLPANVAASSLWDDKAAGMYQDEKNEFELGDVITVIIEEEADAVQSANTSTDQSSSISAGPGLGIFEFIASLALNYSDEDDAEGETQRTGKIEADITTQIIEKYPNGNFKIEGKKTIKVNNEQQIIKITGIIRPDDISSENTISSKKVADSSIEFEGKGIVNEKQRPNLFQRILNWIF